jgi:hypothetical protein
MVGGVLIFLLLLPEYLETIFGFIVLVIVLVGSGFLGSQVILRWIVK